jgi:hypothetical protein
LGILIILLSSGLNEFLYKNVTQNEKGGHTMTNISAIPELQDADRLQIYKYLTDACSHLYSKNNLQKEKFDAIAPTFVKLAKEDPIFLAHLTAWAMNHDSKDLKVLSVYFNSLSDANGEPFVVGGKKRKPNFRSVSAAVLQDMPPHLALRVLELTRIKFAVDGKLSNGAHYPTQLKNAFKKYILYREANPDMIRGIKNSGMGKKLIKMYKMLHMAPTDETAAILGWKQRGRNIKLDKIDFSNMEPSEIAEQIITKKMSPVIALSAIPEKSMNAVVAKALLKTATGNQAIILQNMFRTKGFLEIPEIKSLFDTKIKTATTAVDRIDTLSKNLTDDEKKTMSDVRSKVRKEQMGEIGKVFLHIDKSSSMSGAIEFAKESGSIIAECVNNPEKNFNWGLFGSRGKTIKKPDSFTKEDFYAALYGVKADEGATDCLGCYEMSRQLGTDVDIFVTDQGHNVGYLDKRLKDIHDKMGKPSAVVIVHFGSASSTALKDAFEREGVPVSIMSPKSIRESALVSQAIKTAIRGQMAVIDEIMDTPLPSLPKWWNDISLEEDYKKRISVNV